MRLSKQLKQKVKKVDKVGYFQQGQSMVFVKNWQFFNLFIFGKVVKENAFDDIPGS